jgi:hypothetical protein
VPALDHEAHVLRDAEVARRVAGNADEFLETAGPNHAVADRVRGDADVGAMRLVGDRRELLVRVRLRAATRAMRHHAARGRDLDDLRAAADLYSTRSKRADSSAVRS